MPSARLYSHASYSTSRFSKSPSLTASRILTNSRSLHLTHKLALAIAALALEQARRNALCEASTTRRANEMAARKPTKSSLMNLALAAKRIAALAAIFAPAIVVAPVAYLTSNALPALTEATWEYSLWGIESAGPTFIKLCQWASTRSDLFPQEFCLRFARLQDATRGHSWSETEKTLSTAFGGNWDRVLTLDKSHRPIGSGCIAQVYHGYLHEPMKAPLDRDSTEPIEVAVKVVHPHIREKVEMDFYILEKVATWLEAIPRLNLEYLSLRDSVEQFRQVMVPQLDLRCEARNLDRFRLHFADTDVVNFPEPKPSHVTQNILVESFVHGDRILSYTNPSASKKDKEELAELGVKTVLDMIFKYDFIHGDLHPGNILVNRNSNNKLALNLLDCGIVVEMGEEDHKNLISILGALIKRNGHLAGKLMVDTAKHKNATAEDVRLFCEGIQKICRDDEEQNFLEKVGDYLADICDMARKHKVKLESKFINAALAVEIIEGCACKLHPEMQVQHIAIPSIMKAEAYHRFNKGIGSAGSLFDHSKS